MKASIRFYIKERIMEKLSRVILVSGLIAALITGCSSSSSNQPSDPVTVAPASEQYASSVWPKLHQNNFNTGLSMVDTSSVTGTTIIWTFHAGSKVDSSPAIGADGTIYVGCENGNLYALDPADGTPKWVFPTGGEIYTSSPAISADGTIYIGSETGFFAINPDGTQKWSYPTGDSEAGSPSIGADGTIYLASWDHNLYALNPDGSLKWKFTTGDSMDESPAIGADGTIYVGSGDSYLYAINPDGTKKWSFKAKNQEGMSTPSIGSDGTLIVGSENGYLYSINSHLEGD
jgi:glucose dehydrogenase